MTAFLSTENLAGAAGDCAHAVSFIPSDLSSPGMLPADRSEWSKQHMMVDWILLSGVLQW
jgi:hypothetical protein